MSETVALSGAGDTLPPGSAVDLRDFGGHATARDAMCGMLLI